MTFYLLYESVQQTEHTSSRGDYNSCHIQGQPEAKSILMAAHRMPRYPGNQVSLSAKAPDVGCLEWQ